MENVKNKWFLGGTCSGEDWRKELIPYLEKRNIDYFNPLIKGRPWEQSDEENENIEKNQKGSSFSFYAKYRNFFNS